MLCNNRNHHGEKPVPRNREEPQLAASTEKPEGRNEDPEQSKKLIFKKRMEFL